MTETQFWQLIDQGRAGCPEEPRTGLTRLLAARSRYEIAQFAAIYYRLRSDAATWHLYGAAGIATDGHSEDGFIDFIDWLISAGEQTYRSVLNDPDSLVDYLDAEFPMYEGFGCAGRDALELRGESTDWTREERKLFGRSGGELHGPRTWTNLEDLRSLFPRLAEWDDGTVLP